MIGEMIAAGGSLREGVVTSLQTSKSTLETILLALHMEKGYLQKGELEYLLFTKNMMSDLSDR
jgi:nitric oxide reductase NorQ protein